MYCIQCMHHIFEMCISVCLNISSISLKTLKCRSIGYTNCGHHSSGIWLRWRWHCKSYPHPLDTIKSCIMLHPLQFTGTKKIQKWVAVVHKASGAVSGCHPNGTPHTPGANVVACIQMSLVETWPKFRQFHIRLFPNISLMRFASNDLICKSVCLSLRIIKAWSETCLWGEGWNSETPAISGQSDLAKLKVTIHAIQRKETLECAHHVHPSDTFSDHPAWVLSHEPLSLCPIIPQLYVEHC